MSELPSGWAGATVSEVGSTTEQAVLTGPFGASLGKADFRTSGVPVFTIGCLGNGHIIEEKLSFISDQKAEELATYRLREGDLMFSRMATVGRVGFVPPQFAGSIFNYHLMRLRLCDAVIEPRFFYHYIKGAELVTTYLADKNRGATRDGINTKLLEQLPISLPPLAEQKRIVAKLDALNAKSARARTELARIETLVSRYKQAVLSKAFSGELTQEWRLRAKQSDLESILKSVRDSRQNSRKLARRKTVSEVPLAPLPDAWRWISPDELAADAPYSIGIGPFGSNLVKADYRARGVRLVFVRDIRREEFSSENAVFVDDAKAAELHQHWVAGGDLLITKMGDPPGDTAIFPFGQPAAVITADCIKLRPHLDLTSSEFLYWAIRSKVVKVQILEETKGVAQQKLSLDRFRQIAIPTPPLEEQQEIVRCIESAFAKIDRMAGEARRPLELVGRLDEALLAKAFRGELVPQDASDEPAEHLLARIRAEREKAPKVRRGRGAKA